MSHERPPDSGDGGGQPVTSPGTSRLSGWRGTVTCGIGVVRAMAITSSGERSRQ